ncbi:hypothetical protein [Kitasatospora sp. NPDC058046]|uniref:hypothetical protein n=1 Tax=Kitasatospora sp. NPDC058046 TaxID=3346312 RepID=UPI0036D7D0DD
MPTATPHPREPDVLPLLRQGLTNSEIDRRIGVDHRQVARIRHAHGIPNIACSEWRARVDHPQGRKIRLLLDEGYTNAEISRRTGADAQTVARAREAGAFGPPTIPPAPPPRRIPAPGRTLTARWASRLQLVDGGHLVWTGTRSRRGGGSPIIKAGDRNLSAGHLSYTWATGRPPVGHVHPGCGYPGCLAPAHLEDAGDRTRTRRAVRAVLVQDEAPAVCRRGHDQRKAGRFDPDGHAHCAVCRRDGARARRAG